MQFEFYYGYTHRSLYPIKLVSDKSHQTPYPVTTPLPYFETEMAVSIIHWESVNH